LFFGDISVFSLKAPPASLLYRLSSMPILGLETSFKIFESTISGSQAGRTEERGDEEDEIREIRLTL